jgi:hypothetical protein
MGTSSGPVSSVRISRRWTSGLTEERESLERCCLDMGGTPSTWNPEEVEGLDPDSCPYSTFTYTSASDSDPSCQKTYPLISPRTARVGIITLEPPSSIRRLGFLQISSSSSSRWGRHSAHRIRRSTTELSPQFLVLLPQVCIFRLYSFEVLHTR